MKNQSQFPEYLQPWLIEFGYTKKADGTFEKIIPFCVYNADFNPETGMISFSANMELYNYKPLRVILRRFKVPKTRNEFIKCMAN